MITLLIFIAVLMVLVLSHEFGHFIAARKNGVTVHEFGFGFPPRLGGILVMHRENDDASLPARRYRLVLGSQEPTELIPEPGYRLGTLYSLNLLPLGGFVKIKGENSLDGELTAPDSFVTKKIWQKTLILAAGVIMNVLVAYVCITAGLIAGLPQEVSSWQDVSNVEDRAVEILAVSPDRPAATAGIQPGDRILAIDSIANPRLQEVQDYTAVHAGKPIKLDIERAGVRLSLTATPTVAPGAERATFGVSISELGTVHYPWYKALGEAAKTTVLGLRDIFVGLYVLVRDIVTGKGAPAGVAGPVGIAKMTGQVADLGFIYLVQFTALLSLNLAALNILPIPALDGGRLLFVFISAVLRRPVTPKYEQMAHVIGFGALLVLVAIVTAKDINLLGRLGQLWQAIF